MGKWDVGLRKELSVDQMVHSILDFPFHRLQESLGPERAATAMTTIFSDFDSTSTNKTKGAVGQYLVLANLLKDSEVVIHNIERNLDVVMVAGEALNIRRVDIQALVGGVLKDIEVKVFLERTWQENLQQSMKFVASDPANGTRNKAGQLFNDIVAFSQGNTGKQWHFLPSVNATSEDILEYIRQQILDPSISKNLQRLLANGEDLTPFEWLQRVDTLIEEMDEAGFVVVNSLNVLVGDK
ncbi:hypothetical protein [Pelagibaculum spongiae]|uniref:hypothetical protein n=1 Tax=Pelagibaculum spongiae TaxID=2080658 RepID=UPI0010577C8E|nr:hypothetical protein [Pelagibaculum spongiae]